MKENVDYKLIEFTEAENSIEDQWTIELLTGPFVGTKIQYGTITIDEETDLLNFNYEIVEKSDPELTENNPELIEAVKTILSNVLSDALDLLESQENKNG